VFYAFDHVTLCFNVFKLLMFGAQVVQVVPGPHKSLCKCCTCLGGMFYNLTPLRLTYLLSTSDKISNGD
jgi:hypothetical protein